MAWREFGDGRKESGRLPRIQLAAGRGLEHPCGPESILSALHAAPVLERVVVLASYWLPTSSGLTSSPRALLSAEPAVGAWKKRPQLPATPLLRKAALPFQSAPDPSDGRRATAPPTPRPQPTVVAYRGPSLARAGADGKLRSGPPLCSARSPSRQRRLVQVNDCVSSVKVRTGPLFQRDGLLLPYPIPQDSAPDPPLNLTSNKSRAAANTTAFHLVLVREHSVPSRKPCGRWAIFRALKLMNPHPCDT